MTKNTETRSRPKLWLSAGLITAGLAGGAILGTTFTASAATSTTTPSSSSSSGSSSPSGSGSSSTQRPAMPAPGSAAHENAETTVTGSAATQAQAAAVKYVGSGTAGAVTTDFNKKGYEVTVTKADGTKVEVHLDSSFNVVQGGPGHGGAGCDHGGQAPPASSGNGGQTPPASSSSNSAA